MSATSVKPVPSTQPIKLANVEDIYLMSPMQQGILFHCLCEPGAGMYCLVLSCQLEAALDVRALRRAWKEVVQRHAVLRTGFLWEELERPMQVVRKSVELPWREEDWRGYDKSEQEAKWRKLILEERNQGFDFKEAPMLRLSLIRTGEENYYFIWNSHHIVLDGWCLQIVMEEAFALYAAYTQGQKPQLRNPRPYRDYITWLQKQDEKKAEAFWREELKGFTGSTRLGIERKREAWPEGEEEYGKLEACLGRAYTEKLDEMARRQQVTPSAIVQSAWAIVLSRYSGANDVVFGATASGRSGGGGAFENTVGLFINTLPVRVRLRGDERASALQARVQQRQARGLDYEYSSLLKVQEWSDIPRGTTLFENIIVFENYPVNAAMEEWSAHSLKVTAVTSIEINNYPLAIVIRPGAELTFNCHYSRRLYDQQDVERLLARLRVALEQIIHDPEVCISDISLLTAAERQQLMDEPGWNGPALEVPREQHIGVLVADHAKRNPHAIALHTKDGDLSYASLNRRVNQWAHYLIKEGVTPGARVGLWLEQPEDLVAAALGILKSGGVLVGLEPDERPQRISRMLKNFDVSLVIGEKTLPENPLPLAARWLLIDEERTEVSEQSEEDPNVTINAGDVACVLPRSSAGARPTGVVIKHHALFGPAISTESGRSKTSESDRIAQVLSFAREVASIEMFRTLGAGACLVALPSSQAPRKLAALLRDQKVTVWWASSSLLESVEREFPWALKNVCQVVCEERISVLQQLRKTLPPEALQRVYGAYGYSEAGGRALLFSLAAITPSDAVPVKKVEDGIRIYLLDQRLEPAGEDMLGEIYLGGDSLALGYESDEQMTAGVFVADPYSESINAKMFRTGDWAWRRADGALEFCGRTDGRTNVDGVRVEAEEIEAALLEQDQVSGAAVVMREADEKAEASLVALVEGKDGQTLVAEDLRRSLLEQLPLIMTPKRFIQIERVPRTVDGRVDRKALIRVLQAEEASEAAPEYVAPRNEIEEKLASIWVRTFAVDRIGIHDNFFQLGGNSLLAMQVMARINSAFQVEFPLRRLFEAPTVAQLSTVVEQLLEAGNTEKGSPIVRVPREHFMPLSYAQQRLWFIDQLEPATSAYNVPAAVRVPGPIDVKVLERAFQEVVRRHEPLRTHFVLIQGEPQQVIEETFSFQLAFVDLSAASLADREEQARLLAREEARKSFDLSRGPLIRVKLLRLAAEEHVLLVTMHHIVCDGWSMGVLMGEVSTLYSSFSAGKPSPLAELPIQYVDYSVWQRQWLHGEMMDQQLDYWRKQLANVEVLDLPTDRPRPSIQTQNGDRMTVALPQGLTDKIRSLAKAKSATLYMALLAAFQVLLYRYTRQESFAVGAPIAGRRRAETEGLIGFFVNTLVLRSKLTGQMSLSELLESVKEVTLEAYTHQDVPFEKLVEELRPKRDLGQSPLFQTVFVLQNIPPSELQLGMSKLLPFSGVEASIAKFDLTLELWDTGSEVRGALEYNTDLFTAERISRMVDHYKAILNAMVTGTEQVISEFSMLTEQERRQMVVTWNRTEAEYPREKCLHQLFEEQASLIPEAVAVDYETRWLTYNELDQCANQLAHYLQRLGVGPEVKVGICIERSLEMVVSLLAILKSGGAYVPLDPTYPEQRLRYMAADSNIDIVLAQPSTRGLFADSNVQVICPDSNWAEIAGNSTSAPVCLATSDNLAYVIYTSGSTGAPKAVGVSHSSVVRLVRGCNFADLSGGRKFLQFAPIGFDTSVLEIWGCLLNGGTLAVFTAGTAAIEDLAEFIETRAVDTAWLTSGLFHQIFEVAGEKLQGVRQLIVGGDVVSPAWARRALQSAPGQVLINGYGPTENATFTTCHRMEKVEDAGPGSVPIGKPISNTQVYVLDEKMNLVPIGVPGELYTGGAGLARGYLNSAELTAKKFVPNPFSHEPGSRLYRTGDLVRWSSNGNLEFIERLDNQVKVRGYRIELGEIEAALERAEGVEQAVVITRDTQFGEKQLVAYVVMPGERPVNALRASVKQHLPEYMVPAHFVKLDELPLTTNGKIDRQALPSPTADALPRCEQYVVPETLLEKELANIWSELLGLEQVSIHDDFFEVGGHSLLAIRMRSMVQDRLKRDLSLRDLFRAPTIASLARLLEQVSDQPSDQPAIIVEIQPYGSRTPFFAVHPVGGNVLCYADLARELGVEQPFYGLQAPAPTLKTDAATTFEQMAALYIQAMRSVQPSGPYQLGGWSLGGLLAWEIARQLTDEGETVGLLALIDTYPIDNASSDKTLEDSDVLRWFAGDMARLLGKDADAMRNSFEELGPEEQWTMVQNALVQYGVVPGENAHAEMTRLIEIFSRNFRAMERYSLRQAEQNILLLLAAEGQAPEQLARQWEQWAGGGVECHSIPGDHYTMIRRPNVTVIAEALSRRLNDLSERAAEAAAAVGRESL
ncbi:MAG TPA: amino acid adenylation domain-containing protein [Candidatus Angelobacter sp.]|nr:amino acid adenylation domain-containing protein [Candidatus Angelobacter sp.]